MKKRDDRFEIHDGWIKLRTDLHLQHGDVCSFKRRATDREFKLRFISESCNLNQYEQLHIFAELCLYESL